MISMHYFAQLRALIDAGENNSAISRKLKIDRGTVRKYRMSNSPPKYTERASPTRVNRLAEFEEQINHWIESDPTICGTSIFLILKDRGYQGCQRSVERRILAIKSRLPKERFFEQEYTPGEQSQFDFKESVGMPFRDGIRICHLFVATLPYSSRFFAKAYPNKTYEAFADGFHSFFETIGGMTEAVRFDNLSPVVKKVLVGSERLYTGAFDRALAYYDFKALPCAPGKGNQKGDCERDIRTFARRIVETIKLMGKVFADIHDLNIWLADFSARGLSERNYGLLAEETLKLKVLPPRDESVLCHVTTSHVSKYGTVTVNRSRYSVPDHLILQTVKAVVGPFDVKIYRTSPKCELQATHPRLQRGDNSILLEHTISSLVRKPQAMVRWAHRKILFPEPVFEKYYRFLKEVVPNGAESEYLKSLNLIHFAAVAEIAIGIEILMKAGSQDPFHDLKSLVLVPGGFPTPSASELTQCQPPLNTELSHYDSLIPA